MDMQKKECFENVPKAPSDKTRRSANANLVGPWAPYWFSVGPLLVFPGPPTGFLAFGREVRSLGLQKRNEATNFGVVLFAPQCMSATAPRSKNSDPKNH